MSDGVFRFGDPPQSRRGPDPRQAEAARKLRENPGQWAFVATCNSRSRASGMATGIRMGRATTWRPAGDFDAVSRTVEGEHRVYARYLGEGELPDE